MCRFVGTNSNFLSAFKLLALNEGPREQNMNQGPSPWVPHSWVASGKWVFWGCCSKSGYMWWPRKCWVNHEHILLQGGRWVKHRREGSSPTRRLVLRASVVNGAGNSSFRRWRWQWQCCACPRFSPQWRGLTQRGGSVQHMSAAL